MLLLPITDEQQVLSKIADFLANVTDAWRGASQEQRNKLAKELFQEIWIKDDKVIAAKPRPEFESFSKLNLECRVKSIAGDPEGAWGF